MSSDHWIIYSQTTGDVVYRGYGLPGAAAIQPVPQGHALLPMPSAVWDMQGNDDPEAQAQFLAGLRAALWEQVKVERARLKTMPLATPVGVLDADLAARETIGTLAAGAIAASITGIEMPLTLTLSGNGRADVLPSQMLEIVTILAARDNDQHARSQYLRGLIEAAETTNDLLKIDFANGWLTGGDDGSA